MASFKGIQGVQMITEADLLPKVSQTAPTDPPPAPDPLPAPPAPPISDPTPIPEESSVVTEEVDDYENWTYDDLLVKAVELEIPGGSDMDRIELIEAIISSELV
jgi:hypothetical protein